MKRHNLKAGLVACAVLMPMQSIAQELEFFEVKSRIIENFKIGSDENRFGPLEFVGGLEMVGANQHFGAISGIAINQDQQRYAAVLDTGFWMLGSIERDAANNAIGITAAIKEIVDTQGVPITAKWQADAEGIAITGDTITVSYERAHRISQYNWTEGETPKITNEFPPPVPLYELRHNRGFEGISYAPAGTPLDRALVGISEKSLDKSQNIMGFVKPVQGDAFEFSLLRKDDFDVTDIGFLPSGDLVVLERRFNVTDSIGMRLRHIMAGEIVKGATVDGDIWVTADFQYQIDNMEGLAITEDDDGTPRLTIVSDDNHSLLQRNLLLEFRLVGKLD